VTGTVGGDGDGDDDEFQADSLRVLSIAKGQSIAGRILQLGQALE
jgi:hypothetical protein